MLLRERCHPPKALPTASAGQKPAVPYRRLMPRSLTGDRLKSGDEAAQPARYT